MPTLQQIRYLVAVADHLHFRRAAEECHVTQPTLSGQLKELEARLGTTLVERSRSRVILTPVGQRIADKGRQVLRDVEEMHALARQDQSPLSSVIRVGVVQSLGSYLMPLVVADLHANHPRLGLYLREGGPSTLVRDLEQGGLDLLFFPLPVARGDFEAMSLFREPIQVVMSTDHPLADADLIDPAQLRGQTVLSLEPGHKLYEQVQMICETYGADLSRDFEGTSLDTIRQMVATGMGVSLMPALYVKSEVARHDIVVAKSFRGTAPSITIGMIWRRGTAREEEYRALAALMCQTLKAVAPEVTVLG
ncbi:MAG: LysR substrate-binding domain-containing protein [Pseudomonadota bacterium]